MPCSDIGRETSNDVITKIVKLSRNLDKLTYAGNLENLKGVEGDPRHVFIQGDICDKELVAKLIAEYDPDYIINFAAESHVDRSIANPEIFVETNVMGTVNLLQRAKEAWYDAGAKAWKPGKKYVQVSTDEVYGALGGGRVFYGVHADQSAFSLFVFQGVCGSFCEGVP